MALAALARRFERKRHQRADAKKAGEIEEFTRPEREFEESLRRQH